MANFDDSFEDIKPLPPSYVIKYILTASIYISGTYGLSVNNIWSKTFDNPEEANIIIDNLRENKYRDTNVIYRLVPIIDLVP